MGCLMGIRKSPPETGGLQDWRLQITDCRLARMGLFSLTSKLVVVVYRERARLRFLLLVTSKLCLNPSIANPASGKS